MFENSQIKLLYVEIMVHGKNVMINWHTSGTNLKFLHDAKYVMVKQRKLFGES